MILLLLGLVIFFVTHSISIINEPWRDRMVSKIGEGPWKGLYSLVSAVGLVLITWGYGLARADEVVLYSPAPWLNHVAMLLLIPVFPLLLATYLPGRIKTITKHPMLIAIKLWALAHLLVNGTLADVLLFGAFLTWAMVDRISMKHRGQHPAPGAAPTKVSDLIAVVGGLAIYLAFLFWLHALLIGISPLGTMR